ncbi:B3 domain-containing protein [Populus alba x Populus x berolinensis]|uniref:B3 domain-containing protein n=1 Tax=Populus alba x Populus x berolinensis TaxID=444605 RepID=A0AAD6MIE2_9ROSI|nr:B3 domain-containing protein [Populus alba x Populus x berolinensis]
MINQGNQGSLEAASERKTHSVYSMIVLKLSLLLWNWQRRFETNLEAAYPSFAKTLVRSNVTVGFWMVYIVKGNGSSQGDGEFGIPSSGAYGKEIISEPAEKDVKSSKKSELLELLPVGQEENNQENGLIAVENNKGYVADQSENESEDRASETLRVIKLSGPSVDFNNVKGIENFRILLNGFAIDSELSEHHRTKYYELCRSQNSFLHSNLLNSINHKLAVEIIIGTVDISEGIRSSKLSSSQADYGVWDKTLKGFELLGMKVGFLRERLSRLMSLALESEEAMESECREVRLEQARVDEEMKKP